VSYGAHLLLSSLLGLVCMYGLWRMWRWSLFVYAALCLIDLAYYWVLLRRHVYAPVLGCVLSAVCFLYVRKMR
jgi:hypothetical protein